MAGMSLEGRRVLVVGLARSGEAVAELLLRRRADVTVTDRRAKEALGAGVSRLQQAGARLVLGSHPESIFVNQDLIVVSPGVPRDLPGLLAAQAAGVEIIGELELASRHLEAPVIAITGTNGKSTTTTFVGHFLRASGQRVFVGGNLGTPLSRAVDSDWDWLVVEVSSFQLEWAPSFHPHVALLLNVTPDHLDRYESFEDYARTKGLIFSQQKPDDKAVINQADAWAVKLAGEGRATCYSFGHTLEVTRGIRHLDDALWVGSGEDWRRVSIAGFLPRGRHNIENLMAAFMAAHLTGVPIEELERAIPLLEGLPHRLEFIRTVGGVRYYNDSKATNVASVECSLRDLAEPLVLLMGGRDKGGSYAPLLPIVKRSVHTLVLFGEAAPLIRAALGDETRVVEVETLEQALEAAHGAAQPGDSVVMSPACSSFDQFPNYEVRGDTFRQLVWQLPESAGPSGKEE